MPVTPSFWLPILKKLIRTLNEKGLTTVFFGGVCHSVYLQPADTKDIDVVVYPFPKGNDALALKDEIADFVGAIRSYILTSKVDGNRIVVECPVPYGFPFGIELWEKVLRRDPRSFVERAVEGKIDGLRLRVFNEIDYLTSKLADFFPDPTDAAKVREFVEKMDVDCEKIFERIVGLGLEVQAIYNLSLFFERIPRKLKPLYARLVDSLPPHLKAELKGRLRSIGVKTAI
jgi:hypothetical protein